MITLIDMVMHYNKVLIEQWVGACTLSIINEGNMDKHVLDDLQSKYKFTYTHESTKDFPCKFR